MEFPKSTKICDSRMPKQLLLVLETPETPERHLVTVIKKLINTLHCYNVLCTGEQKHSQQHHIMFVRKIITLLLIKCQE